MSLEPAVPIGRPGPEPAPIAQYPWSARLAGLIILLGGLVNLATALLAPYLTHPSGVGVIDLVLGWLLLVGANGALGLARARTWLGLVFGPMLAAHFFGWPAAVLQIVLCTGLLLLLAGRPGPGRTLVGAALAFCTMGLGALGLLVLKLEESRLAEPIPADRVVHGLAAPYSFQVPDSGWMLFKTEEVKRRNPLLDRWAYHPLDLHVTVLPEEIEPGSLSLQRFRDQLVRQRQAKGWELKDEQPEGEGRLVHFARRKVERLELLLVKDKYAVQVHVSGERQAFQNHEAELKGVLKSFQWEK